MEERFKARLLALRGELSEAAFAKKIGIPVSTVKNYYAGSMPSLDKAAVIAKTFDTTIDWLWGWSDLGGPDDATSTMPLAHETVSIPRFEVQAAAGDGSEVLSQEAADYFRVSKDWISRFVPNGANLGMIEARGDSMEPTIHDGDGLIVNFNITTTDINQGGVFIISNADGVKVKRLQIMMDGRIRISSDNEKYEPEYVDKEFADEHLTIHSKVIFGIGPLRSR